MNNKRIVILYGELAPDAPQDEQDVLVEVETVRAALAELGFEPVDLPLTLDLEQARQKLCTLAPALVFNLVESINSSGRLIHLAPALLEQLHLPYTGAALNPMFITSQKTLTKQLLQQAGIPTPAWLELKVKPGKKPDAAAPAFAPPYILKSIWEHASIGLDEQSIISGREGLLQTLNNPARTTPSPGSAAQHFIEAYIEGREFNLALLDSERGVEVLPPAEIRFVDFPAHKPKIVGYKAKWDDASFEYHHTPRSFAFPEEDSQLLEKLKSIALQCWHLFNLKGYARVDFRVDERSQPWVLEINVNPCISPEAGFMAAAGQAGLSRNDVIRRIIQAV